MLTTTGTYGRSGSAVMLTFWTHSIWSITTKHRSCRGSRPDVKGVVRMSEADGITVRVMTGRTPLGRRLAMVGDVDVVVTIYGRQHTEVVVERSLDRGCQSFLFQTLVAIRSIFCANIDRS